MKQEIIDKFARLDYQDEKVHVKRLKSQLKGIEAYHAPSLKETYLYLLKYHKDRLAYMKRRLPMKPAKEEDAMWALDVCPCCRSVARLYKNYCEECGQRLMWE